MDSYEIGKDISDLNMRLSRLEHAFNDLTEQLNAERVAKNDSNATR
jgi:hypothetical protein